MKFDLYKAFDYNINVSSLSSQLEKMRLKEKALIEELGKHLADMIKVYAEQQYQTQPPLKRDYDNPDEYLKHQKNILIDDFVGKVEKFVKQEVKKKLK